VAKELAVEYPDIQFCQATCEDATDDVPNYHNYMGTIYQGRYISGVVAGLKLAELEAAGSIPDENKDENGNIKIGYVGAFPYAEVKSGYTAFYLGVKSIVDNVVMDVSFTNSWFDMTKEGEAANALIARGCMIIGQHADSTGAPAAVQAAYESGKSVYSVGYNIDMISVAPDVALTSATNNWAVYYTYAIEKAMNGEKIDTDWAEGYEEDAVQITDLNGICAEGTAEKVAEVESKIQSGELHVFDTSTFTVDGKQVEECVVDLTGNYETTDEGDKNAVWDGYFHESELRSAPYFSLDIDGITLLN
jgi:basic membrane protein A